MVTSRRSDSLADRTSLSFTERMIGFRVHGTSDPRGEAGAGARERFAFRLTITIDDVSRFLADPDHLARAEGWIDAAHGGRHPVQRGRFSLFAPGDTPDCRVMRYRLHYTDAAGRPRTLAGWKHTRPGPVTRVWPDTSTLYFQMYDGHVDVDADRYHAGGADGHCAGGADGHCAGGADGHCAGGADGHRAKGADGRFEVVGAGTLRIRLVDFARQLTTFRTRGPGGFGALARFTAFFCAQLWNVYRPRSGRSRSDREESPAHLR